MGRVHRVTPVGGDRSFDPRDQQITEIMRVVDDQVEFGEPQDPNDPTSTTLAGVMGAAGAHNGTHSNISGSWVEISLTAAVPTIIDKDCVHNLYLHDPDYTVPNTAEPNCRWLVFGIMHDGTGGDGTSYWNLDVFFEGGTVAANELPLRFRLENAGGQAYTIGAANPVIVTLFFTRATQGHL